MDSISSTMRRASARFRASGFSHATPISSPFPRVTASTICSTTATRLSFVVEIHSAST